MLLEGLFGGVDQVVGLVAGVDDFAAFLVVGLVVLGVLGHLVDLGLGQAGGAFDLDLLLLGGGHVLGRDVEDAVGVDVEGDFDLGHAAGGRGDAGQFEPAEGPVVLGELPFALEDVDFDFGLVIGGGREGFLLARRDGRVPRDQDGHHAAEGLDAQRQRGHVEQDDVFLFAGEDRALDGGPDGDHFVRVDALVGLLAEDLLGDLLDLRGAGGAADEDDFVDLLGLELGVLQGPVAGGLEALEDRLAQLLELRPA